MSDINQTYKKKISELNILGIKINNNILGFRHITFYTFTNFYFFIYIKYSFKIIIFTFFTIIFNLNNILL